MTSRIENMDIVYKGKKVRGKKLTVSSELAIDIAKAWSEVLKSSLLEFVCEGKITFKPTEREFPKIWKKGMETKTKMLIHGFLPVGGIHSIKFIDIDPQKFVIITNERNSTVKVWNHTIEMKILDKNRIEYRDKIELYAGFFTRFVALWAKSFYRFRQRKWKLVVEKIKTNAQH